MQLNLFRAMFLASVYRVAFRSQMLFDMNTEINIKKNSEVNDMHNKYSYK